MHEKRISEIQRMLDKANHFLKNEMFPHIFYKESPQIIQELLDEVKRLNEEREVVHGAIKLYAALEGITSKSPEE